MRYAIGVLAFLASFVARLLLSPILGLTVPYMFFFPGIVLSAWYGGLGPGLVTTALSATSSIYFLRSMNGGFSTASKAGWVIFVCVGGFLSWLNYAFRRSELRTRDELQARMQYEEALRVSEERLTLALEAGGGVGTWDWDIPNDLVYCDPQFAALYSVDPKRGAIGIPRSEFMSAIHPEDLPAVEQSVQQALRNGGDFEEEYRLVLQDQSHRWLCARGRCHLDNGGRPVRLPGVAFDVTGRKHAEENLKRSNEELKRLNRELEEFAYVTSHDLQEPLRMVSIYTQLLLKRLDSEDANLNQYSGFIRQGVMRMEMLLRDLLSFSRTIHTREELAVGAAELSASLAEALSVLKAQIEENNAVIHTETLPTVRGETSQLTHVFQNLISNALKYRTQDIPPAIYISAARDGDRWVISVRDNGIGFQQQYAEQIFGLFKRLHKHEYPGTGLGLAICERIVERYGGRIWAESEPGHGSTFRFSLPAA